MLYKDRQSNVVNRLIAQLPWLVVSCPLQIWASGHHHPKQLPILGEHQPVNYDELCLSATLRLFRFFFWFNQFKSFLSLSLSFSVFLLFSQAFGFTKHHPDYTGHSFARSSTGLHPAVSQTLQRSQQHRPPKSSHVGPPGRSHLTSTREIDVFTPMVLPTNMREIEGVSGLRTDYIG